MRWKILTLTSFLNGCITESGFVSNQDGSIRLQCRENWKFADEELALLECELENPAQSQENFQISKLGLPQGYSGRFASPGDIASVQSMESDSGKVKALSALVLVAASAMGSQGSSGPVGAAGVASIATLPSSPRPPTAFSGNGMPDPRYGDSHLLGRPLTLAPGASGLRSALVALDRDRQPPKSLTVCFEKPAKECLQAPVEPWSGRSRQRPGLPTESLESL